MTAKDLPDYVLGDDAELAADHVRYLAELLDPQSTACLEATGLRPGMRCLDVGAGGGSISRWLAGYGADVLAVDVDTTHLAESPGVEVLRHDITDGVPGRGKFDLIHVRLVLMHLSRRAGLLAMLADRLTPGGWLVIGDYVGPQTRVVTASSPAEEALFHRVQQTAHAAAANAGAVSFTWAHEVDERMREVGLVNIEARSFIHTAQGGGTASLLSSNLVRQVEKLALNEGLAAEDLRAYYELMLDPRFRSWFYEFVCTRGQRL
ncbi:class I SAM-dependent methyltransferase [Sciscionella marina]|uniref:class I SAM-dependent methyltransferase n=1 Tax=Sciscionella marina TaxID=508770 RepID=UPI00036194F9|nr:class I SAM-dependent methyltransferase [Sciscionella marina]